MFNPVDITSGMILTHKRYGYKYEIKNITRIEQVGLHANYYCDLTKLNVYQGFFGYVDYILDTSIKPIDKQAMIIAKIKYLNTRFNTRKQHAALG